MYAAQCRSNYLSASYMNCPCVAGSELSGAERTVCSVRIVQVTRIHVRRYSIPVRGSALFRSKIISCFDRCVRTADDRTDSRGQEFTREDTTRQEKRGQHRTGLEKTEQDRTGLQDSSILCLLSILSVSKLSAVWSCVRFNISSSQIILCDFHHTREM